MQQERWQRINEIFHSALNMDADHRAAFLDGTCSGDTDLRTEVERLLIHCNSDDSFLEEPAIELAAVTGHTYVSHPAMEGEMVSHYRVEAKLGSGGMGVVYEGEDLKLGRRVALKFLYEDWTRESQAISRLHAEARAASSLNHPSICTIYAIEEYRGQPVLVMELLEGQNLRQRMEAAPVSTEELIRIGVQVCDALTAAHAKGIIHRDIKPANIFLTNDGRLKLLDFGVAKWMRPAEPEGHQGTIAGTVLYMSPEQLRGEEIDGQSDVFSLGIVLYELATGVRPFERSNVLLTVEAVLNANVAAPSTLNPGLPVNLDRVIGKMTAKDREQRYRSAADVSEDFKLLTEVLTRTGRKWKVVSVGAGVASVCGVGAILFESHRTPVLTNKDTVVLADFANSTGYPVFDGTLRQGLAVQLEQSPFLSLISDQRIHHLLRLMGRSPGAGLSPELSREICERTGSAAVLEGSIANLGSHYVLGLRAKSCRTGDVLDDESAQAARKEDILNVLSQIAARLRTRVGESLSSIQQHDTPLAEATTPSLEALESYSAGLKVHFANGAAAALPLFRRAVEIDPEFAMAHAWLGRTYANLDESELSMQNISKAWQLRNRVSDHEKFAITTRYHALVTGNLEATRQTCEAWTQTYPRDPQPHIGLSVYYRAAGQYERAAAESRKAIEVDPDFSIGYYELALSQVYLNRREEAENTLRRAGGRGLEIDEFIMLGYNIAFLKGDQAGMEREAARARERYGGENWIADKKAFTLAHSGQLRQARNMSRRAVAAAQQAGQRERASLWEAAAALREAMFGNSVEAKKRATAALALSKVRDVEYGAAFALALAGDSFHSEILAHDLETRFPEDTAVQFTYLPVLRARVALDRADVSKAMELLRTAVPHELGTPRGAPFGALYPIFVRGEAYLAAHQGAAAAAEFQKVLDHRGIVVSDPVGALAHLQLGRAYALSGNVTKSKSAYQNFLTLWKDADRDIPVLRQAEDEYAKLQ